MIPLLLGAVTNGLMLAFLALGILISYRIFKFPDITADSSYTFGAVITAVSITGGIHPGIAIILSFCAGFCAGIMTGTLHAYFKINKILAGILVMIALYSVNLYIMSGVVIYLQADQKTIMDYIDAVGMALSGGVPRFTIFGSEIRLLDASIFVFILGEVSLAFWFLRLFFQTHVGLAVRATGDNDHMVRAIGVNNRKMIVLGLAVSNGMIGLSGAHMVQVTGYADIQMGIGMVVIGLASVILGDSFLRKKQFSTSLIGAIAGSVMFRIVIALVLWMGMPSNTLKLFTALFVLGALTLPKWVEKWKRGMPAEAVGEDRA